MAVEMARCEVCGKAFDMNKGGGLDENGNRLVCRSCLALSGREQLKRPSTGGTIAKIVFGLLFLSVSFEEPESGDWLSYFIICLVLCLALLAWAVLPWLRYRRGKMRRSATLDRMQLDRQRQREAAENEPKLCPACGATSRGRVCEYCGSKLE